ncbi:MAG: hypothetical protein JJU11_16405 [Candidatus Sumerlaeia bacterium]|nr:hypothetical protein [Candidatus Sumerlaeia bacterium]
MGFLDPITGFITNQNYVHIVQVVLIVGILVFTAYIMYALGLINLPNKKK